MKLDPVTLFVRKAIDALFLSHKLRTSLGVITGLVLHGLIKVFTPALKQYQNTIDITQAGYIMCIGIGIVGMHIPTIYSLMTKPSLLDEKIDSILQVIEEGKKQNLADWQIKQMYSKLYIKVLNDSYLSDSTKDEIMEASTKETEADTEPN